MLAKLRTQRFDTFAYWPMAYPALANFAQPPDIGRRSREVFGSLIRSVTADRTHLSLDRAVQSPKVAAHGGSVHQFGCTSNKLARTTAAPSLASCSTSVVALDVRHRHADRLGNSGRESRVNLAFAANCT